MFITRVGKKEIVILQKSVSANRLLIGNQKSK